MRDKMMDSFPRSKTVRCVFTGAESKETLVPFCWFQPDYQTYLNPQKVSWWMGNGKTYRGPFLLSPTQHSLLDLLPTDILLITFKEALGKRSPRESRGGAIIVLRQRQRKTAGKDWAQSLVCDAGPAVPRWYQSIRVSSCKKNWISHRLVS